MRKRKDFAIRRQQPSAVRPGRDCSRSAAPATPAVVAYVFAPNGVLPSVEIDAGKLTRVNYVFANLKDSRMVRAIPRMRTTLPHC